MSRASWKGPFLAQSLLKVKAPRKIWSRNSILPGALIGKRVYVYNGKKFKRVIIDRSKVGYKVGEFAITRILTTKKLGKTSSRKKGSKPVMSKVVKAVKKK